MCMHMCTNSATTYIMTTLFDIIQHLLTNCCNPIMVYIIMVDLNVIDVHHVKFVVYSSKFNPQDLEVYRGCTNYLPPHNIALAVFMMCFSIME